MSWGRNYLHQGLNHHGHLECCGYRDRCPAGQVAATRRANLADGKREIVSRASEQSMSSLRSHLHVLSIKAAHPIVLTDRRIRVHPYIVSTILFENACHYNQPCRPTLSFQPFWRHWRSPFLMPCPQSKKTLSSPSETQSRQLIQKHTTPS